MANEMVSEHGVIGVFIPDDSAPGPVVAEAKASGELDGNEEREDGKDNRGEVTFDR